MRPLALCVSLCVCMYVCVCMHALCIAEGKGQRERQPLKGVGGARGGALVILLVVVVLVAS